MFRLFSRYFCLLSAGLLLSGAQPGFFVQAAPPVSIGRAVHAHGTSAPRASSQRISDARNHLADAASSGQQPNTSYDRLYTETILVGDRVNIPGSSHLPVFSCVSSDTTTADVTPDGVITAKKAGAVDILYNTPEGFFCLRLTIATSQEASGAQEGEGISAADPAASAAMAPVELQDPVLFMEPEDAYTVKPAGDLSAAEQAALHWESSDRSVASVSASGKITARKKGSAIITCSNGSSSDSVSVNVVTRDYDGNACDFSILTADGDIRTYRLYKQNAHNYPKYDNYLAWHGCATCSLTSVLGAYNPAYAGILPSEVIDGPEKDTVSRQAWNREHVERSLPRQMPLSLYGITSILNKHGVTADYVRTYNSDEEASADIISHLKTGNPVIFEVRQKSNITGKKSSRWTNSYHTMVLLGVLTNGKVLIYDPVDKNWDNNGNRITITDLSDVMEFMFPCTEIDKAMYYNGASSDGGYIKIYDTADTAQ